ncbi:hypothetical protein SLEP1_g55812 [Rubroshorea leprosula]|uniref:Uncharacterized protein n=1 Tax=Rubroshorea leprosula TaxID=152421 RepID=A0AAV5MHJ5_9ROSI|nr:hypothetical protein SLEP1_g55812 [Rubroshorea leprosula]
MTLTATVACIKGWKPCGNENCFNETYPIQQASYWRIGSHLAILETIRNVLQELKINHYNFEQMHNCQTIKKMVHISVYGEQKEKTLDRKQRFDPRDFADCVFTGSY